MSSRSYVNFSGGCSGADMEWDRIGRELGFLNHTHFRPADLKKMDSQLRERLEEDLRKAAIALGRPTGGFPGKDLVRRNWLIMHPVEAVFAISRIVKPENEDKGFVNKTGREIVSGGTAWACEMAIQKNKPVHVFDMNRNAWYVWDENLYIPEETPVLTSLYAGIGSRNLTKEGVRAIRDVYEKTIKENEQTVLQTDNGSR